MLQIVQTFDVQVFEWLVGPASREEAAMSTLSAVPTPAGSARRPRSAGTGALHEGLSTTNLRLRLTRRGRIVLSALAVAGCLGSVTLVTAAAQASSPGHGIPVVRHTVVTGETLWEVSQSITRPGEDVRVVEADVEQLNHLASEGLQAGQVLWLPSSRVSGS